MADGIVLDVYWQHLCDVRNASQCWVRLISRSATPRWGMLLTIPTRGYLEGPGPVRMKDVEYVELSRQRVRGGLAGRPLELVDIKNELLILLAKTTLEWTLVRTTWTVDRIFDERSVEVVRVSRPPHLPKA